MKSGLIIMKMTILQFTRYITACNHLKKKTSATNNLPGCVCVCVSTESGDSLKKQTIFASGLAKSSTSTIVQCC